MSEHTIIQWADSTVNPVAGCLGCELSPPTMEVTRQIDKCLGDAGAEIDSAAVYRPLIHRWYRKIRKRGSGHKNELTNTNIWHLRKEFCQHVSQRHGKKMGRLADAMIGSLLKCYAAKSTYMRGADITNPDKKVNSGYPPTFEQLTMFPGRVEQASKWKSLTGRKDSPRPWMNDLPRLIFFSDMGDALCSKEFFAFLEGEMGHITSALGRQHLWLWLTKRPRVMRFFADRIGGLPANVCAMTTVTSRKTLPRVDHLRQVKAASRGLSIEPLWERIPPEELDLTGVDWVIVGGESGRGDVVKPFDIAWAEELRDHCKKNGVAFFLKQVGRKPVIAGQPVKLKDPHGGDWDEWPAKLRVRQFPAYFHDYGRCEAPQAG